MLKLRSYFTGLLISVATTSSALAGEPPIYMKETLPEHAMGKILQSWGAVKGEGAALDKKTQELIGLAVAAQIPCAYCVHAHVGRLKEKLGASDAEIKEAIAIAGYIRMFSTIFYGNAYDMGQFKTEFDAALKK